MKDKRVYIIDVEQLDAVLSEFATANGGITISRTDNSNEIKLDLIDGDRKGILHLYHKGGGNYSHYEQGEWNEIAVACWSFIHTRLGKVVEPKVLPAIKKVEQVDFESFVDCFKDSEDYTVENKDCKALGGGTIYVIEDNKCAKVSLTYFNNKTMLIQGASTGLLVKVLTECIDTIPQADQSLIDAILPPDKQVKTVIDADIKKHIDNMIPISGGKIEKLVNTSLTLINSGIVVEDYSPFSTNILRALDAVINGKIAQVAGPVESYHTYFDGNPSSGYKMKNESNPFGTDEELISLMEESYTYYHNHRHPIAHTDHQNVETTRILTYDEAVMEIRDSLQLINRICEKW